MKKTILLMAMFAIVFVACNKEDVIQPLPTVQKPSLTKSLGFNNQNVIAGISSKSAEYQYVVPPNVENFWARMEIYVGGTLSLSNIVSMNVEIRKKSDTGVSLYKFNPVIPVFGTNAFTAVGLSANTTYLYYVTYLTKPGSTGTITTSMMIEAQWNNTMYHTSGVVPGQTTTIYPYGTIPIFEWHELTGSLIDSVEMDMYDFSVTNPGPGRISLPQFTFVINLTDVGNDDTLNAYSPKWIVNGSDSTGRINYTNSSGMQVTNFGEGSNKYYIPYVTGNREARIDPGETYNFKLRFPVAGLRYHSGNGLSLQLLLSDPSYVPQGYINLNTPGINLKITAGQSSGSSGNVFNLTWGLNSSSAIPGNSSKTYLNGYGFTSLGVQYFTQP